MKMLRLLLAFSTLAIPLTVADSATAQTTPLPGTGCPGSFGPIVPGGRDPMASTPWSLECVANPGWNCISGPVLMLGFCSAPIPLGPIGCVAGCSLIVNPSFGTFPTPLVVAAGALPSGFHICAQCACIDAAGCIQISEGLDIVIL